MNGDNYCLNAQCQHISPLFHRFALSHRNDVADPVRGHLQSRLGAWLLILCLLLTRTAERRRGEEIRAVSGPISVDMHHHVLTADWKDYLVSHIMQHAHLELE